MKYLALAWALAAYLLFTDARNVRDYLTLASNLGLRGEAQAPTPLRQVFPAFAPDAQVWIRHALWLDEGGHGFRLRHTDIDNAPMGREVHWNSGWAWAIAGAGHAHRALTGLPLPLATERAAMWLNPLALFVMILVFSSWALRRMGLLPALFITSAMVLQARLLEGFFPYYVDHHGLLTASVFGLVLGAMSMVRGIRGAAVFSALAGAFGLWVGAASTIPAIAATAVAGAIVAPHSDARAWRTWGAVGAAAALAFYALEYFPHHMAPRLEVNHPLYAIAWLAAGELVARRMGRTPMNGAQRWWPWIALVALPATILAGGANVLSFTDPFMVRLHAQHIREFLPMWKALADASTATIVRICVLEAVPLVAALVTLAILRGRTPRLLVFMTLIAAPLLAMAWWQARWQLNASAASVVLALVLVETWTAHSTQRVRALAAIAVAVLLFLPGGWDRYYSAHASLVARVVSPAEAQLALARDVAAVLRMTQPTGDITLLSSPNGSTSVGYYGRFRTLGTLYWENAEGLKAAARILSTPDDAEAERLIRARHVTHIAMFVDENFIEPYLVLLHPKATPQMLQRSFGWRLFASPEVPPWLEPIPYEPPPDLRVLNNPVRLFRVRERLQFATP